MADEARCWNDLAAENARMRELIAEGQRIVHGIYAACSKDERIAAAMAAADWQNKVDAMRAMEEEADDRV